MLKPALRLAANGIRVFPVHTPTGPASCSCGVAECASIGKHPRTRNGLHDASVDEATIRGWWTTWPDANIGVATGQGLLVVDIDGLAGFASWQGLVDEHGDVETITADTGGGGRHLYLMTAEPLRSSHWRLGDYIDTRGEGGYVVAPPSLHASGRRYAWRRDAKEFAAIPDWMLRLLQPRQSVTPQAPPTFSEGTPYGRAILIAALERISKAAEGERNNRLNEESFLIGQWVGGGEIPPYGVLEAIIAAHPRPCNETKVASTARRALHEGAQHPRRKEPT